MIPLQSEFLRQLIAAALTVAFLWNIALSGQPSAATVGALDPGVTAGVGAPLDFAEYEAENGVTNGRIVGPDRTFTTLASEASGRRAVVLEGPRDYVEFTLSAPANALTVRYAVPDGPEGKPVDARLGVYAQGHRIADLAVTSRYCCFYGRYPMRQIPHRRSTFTIWRSSEKSPSAMITSLWRESAARWAAVAASVICWIQQC